MSTYEISSDEPSEDNEMAHYYTTIENLTLREAETNTLQSFTLTIFHVQSPAS